ncbi:MAG: hypothetical protein HYZ53_08770 [Planctomycetes bacterium]|nr:hypothetical protein [Planctomycetota bacterium]
MSLEESLGRHHLRADAAPVRARVLDAAAAARREQRFRRLTLAVAAVALVAVAPLNFLFDGAAPRPRDPRLEREADLLVERKPDPGLHVRLRMALVLRPGPPRARFAGQ